MPKIFKPNKRKRAKKHGFLSRRKTPGGTRTIRRRMRVGRHRLTK